MAHDLSKLIDVAKFEIKKDRKEREAISSRHGSEEDRLERKVIREKRNVDSKPFTRDEILANIKPCAAEIIKRWSLGNVPGNSPILTEKARVFIAAELLGARIDGKLISIYQIADLFSSLPDYTKEMTLKKLEDIQTIYTYSCPTVNDTFGCEFCKVDCEHYMKYITKRYKYDSSKS